ncbi:MAG: UpxY family transcription antiterminator [Psychroserpens sp.]|uniref:UpxY family transcription antiterminator n=1 Tax=Psychroserpens sp. TaxID=2020870 RepID=UPI003CAFBB0A
MKSKKNWYVLMTKPKSEKKVAERLKRMGVQVYCPMKIEVRQWSDRKKKVEVPVLPSTVFVKLEDSNRSIVFNVPGAVRYLFWLGQAAIVPSHEIEILEAAIQSAFQIVDVQEIRPGDTIEIKGLGVLDKQKGTVKYISGNQCWVVLNSLGYVVKMDLK